MEVRMQVDWMYFVAFAGTATGLVIYLYRYCAFSVLLAPNMDRYRVDIYCTGVTAHKSKLLQAGAQNRFPKRQHRLHRPWMRRLQRQTAQHKFLVSEMVGQPPTRTFH
jgi:hypothetical protein